MPSVPSPICLSAGANLRFPLHQAGGTPAQLAFSVCLEEVAGGQAAEKTALGINTASAQPSEIRTLRTPGGSWQSNLSHFLMAPPVPERRL